MIMEQWILWITTSSTISSTTLPRNLHPLFWLDRINFFISTKYLSVIDLDVTIAATV
jgi:hypothetical protein